MLRSIIEVSEYSSRLGRDDRHFVIVARKLADCRQRIKPHDRDELNFRADVAAQQLNTVEPRNAPIFNADEDFLFEQRLIGVGVVRRGPAVPDSDYHVLFSLHGNSLLVVTMPHLK